MTTCIADRYEIVRPLGRGSFAETLLARELSSDRLVAVKVLQPRTAPDWKTFELFDREAAVLRDLRHHAIPAVHELFRAPWQGSEAAFLVMEYVEGVSLAEMIASRRHLDTDEVMHLFMEVLGVLDYLHTRVPPILHRDIKPANLICRPDGSIVLVDFGAVRNVFRSAEEIGSTMVGTYGYMPYEQTMGQASPASDLYALAATFLHLATGRPPPEFMSGQGRLEVPATISCGEPLRRVLARMLAFGPGDRFESARAARNALLAGVPTLGSLIPATANARNLPALAGATPRRLDGEVAAVLKAAAYSPSRILSSSDKFEGRWTIPEMFLVGLFSVFTAGIMPAVVWSVYLGRKRRLKPFIIHGLPAAARVLEMVDETIGFDIKLTRVRYEFEVDGRIYRDSDGVLPVIARRWDQGTIIQIVYLPDRNFDSMVISTS